MSNYKKILVLGNQLEARLMESHLKEREIPHLIKSFYDSAYDGLYQAQKGWGVLRAPEEYEDEIKTIYADLPKPTEEPPDEDLEEEFDDYPDDPPQAES